MGNNGRVELDVPGDDRAAFVVVQVANRDGFSNAAKRRGFAHGVCRQAERTSGDNYQAARRRPGAGLLLHVDCAQRAEQCAQQIDRHLLKVIQQQHQVALHGFDRCGQECAKSWAVGRVDRQIVAQPLGRCQVIHNCAGQGAEECGC